MNQKRNSILIESAQNEYLKAAVKLTASSNALRQEGLAAAEGLHLAHTLLVGLPESNIDSIWIPRSLLNKPEWLAMPKIHELLTNGAVQCRVLSDALYTKLSRLKTPTGPLILFKPVNPRVLIDLNQDLVLLDGIQDPGNVGTILRNCVAAGIDQVALSEHCAWVWSEKVLRASMGAHFSLNIYSEQQVLFALKDQGEGEKEIPIRVTGLHPSGFNLFEISLKPVGIWVFGGEGQGVSQPWLERATQYIRIPQSVHIESMNVGSSSAVCLFEQFRQRHHV